MSNEVTMVGWSFIINAAQSWNLTSTYSEVLAKILNTYLVLNKYVQLQVARTTYACKCVLLQLTYQVSNYVFLQLVRATYSKHACILHLVRTIHSTKYTRSTRFFLIEYVEIIK